MHDTEHLNRSEAPNEGTTSSALRYPQETAAIGSCQLLP